MPEEIGQQSTTIAVTVGRPFLHLLVDDELAAVYVTGDHDAIGAWMPGKAVRMQKMQNESTGSSVWTVTLILPTSTIKSVDELRYRYFIGCARFIDSRIVQVLKWESAAKPRIMTLLDANIEQPTRDEFGLIHGKVSVLDGWLSDPRLTELRLSIFGGQAIQFTQPVRSSTFNNSYKITLQALVWNQRHDEVIVDNGSIISAAVIIDDKKRRAHSAQSNKDKACGELYAAAGDNGAGVLSFRVQTADSSIENLHMRFSISNGEAAGSLIAVADMKHLCRSKTQGISLIPMVDSEQGTVVGKLSVSYLIILPSTPEVVRFSTMEKSFANYWTPRPPLDIGHRGMGRSYTRTAKERENTVKSMQAAFAMGADYVEFDVQLSKDEVPVLYHDFNVCLENENEELRKVSISKLTLDQLNTSTIRHYAALKRSDKKRLSVTDRENEVEDAACAAFPTLKDILRSAPPHLGFNIEIKYPMYLQNGEFESCDEVLEPNSYIDRILEVVVEHAKGRRIMFSSFCPQICTILKLKQNRYPTLFITQGSTDRYVPYAHPLTKSSEIAIEFALSEDLLGVCFHSEDLLRSPDLVRKARAGGLICFVWGDDLDHGENIDFMKRLGVDGVIYDRIDEHTRGMKSNVFLIENNS